MLPALAAVDLAHVLAVVRARARRWGSVPLFNVLGYELAIVGRGVRCDRWARPRCRARARAAVDGRRRRSDARSLSRAVRWRARTSRPRWLAVGVVVPPAVIAAVRGIWIPTCDWWFGIKAYLRDAAGDRGARAVRSATRSGWRLGSREPGGAPRSTVRVGFAIVRRDDRARCDRRRCVASCSAGSWSAAASRSCSALLCLAAVKPHRSTLLALVCR